MSHFKHIGLFEGIGGFSLAARWMGWQTVAWCEWNEFGQKVLKHHFPKAEGFGDITKTDFTKYANKIDILTGGFPCQPYSSAGKRLGKEDERHLWPEMLRAIREISPSFVVGENVRGLTNWNGGLVFDEVCTELENLGYQVAPVIIPACAVDAPHRRERIWFVAYAENSRYRGRLCERCSGREWELLSDKQGWCEMGCKTKGCSGKWITSNTNGAEQTNNTGTNDREAEKIWRQNKGDVSREFCSNGNATNATGFGFCGNGTAEQSQPKTFGTWNGMGAENATDTQCGRGLQRIENLQSEKSNGIWPISDGREWNVTDTNGNRLERSVSSDINRQKSSQEIYDEKCISTRKRALSFEKFPTQPPVCGGDDGLPTELDGITFSKWRNESIKAYGNAIVPQVAYEIFKAIEKTI